MKELESAMNRNNEEIWRPVKDYEEFYAVSDMGNVKSLNYNHTGREQIMKPAKDNEGYLKVTLWKKGIKKTFGVHVIVALSFPEICGLPFEGAQCNHIDEVKTNNVPENLNWLSRKDNLNYGTGIERRAKARSKTVYQYDKKTLELVKEWVSVMEIGRQTGFSQGNISQCCNNNYNPNGTGAHNVYKGFIWSYEQHKRNR